MFTGIIEEMGKIESLDIRGSSGKLKIACSKVLSGTNIGDSIAVNGICLTVTTLSDNGFTADFMAETYRRTGFSNLSVGDKVNLERAMEAGGRFGGHIVSGHVDGTGTIRQIRQEENAWWITVATDSDILKYVVTKGSITLDGTSLTVAAVTDRDLSVSIIPHTGESTILLSKNIGDIVNIETDIIGKYVEKLLEKKDTLTMEDLISGGF